MKKTTKKVKPSATKKLKVKTTKRVAKKAKTVRKPVSAKATTQPTVGM